MIRRIIHFSGENPFLVIIVAAILGVLAVYTLKTIRLDALPDLSDTQVIVYSRWDRSPDIIEDQVTYPIVSGLLGTPRVKAVRGFPISAFLSFTSSFRTGPISIGRVRACWNTFRKSNLACPPA